MEEQKVMKKLLLVGLALALVAFVSTGCNRSGGSGGSSGVSGQSGPVVIELWYGAAVTEAGAPPPNWVALQIIRDKLNIDLRLSALPSNEADQDVRINAAAAANQLPDLFMVRRDPFLNLIRLGLIAPVDDLYAQMPNRTRIHYDEGSRNFTTINGRSFGLASPGAIPRNEGMLIRKDWLDKLNLQIPVTTNDYLNVMRAFSSNPSVTGGQTFGYGAFIEITNHEGVIGARFEPFVGAFGVSGTWNLNKGEAGLNVKKPAYFDALVYIKQILDERLIDPNWLSYNKDDWRAAWKQGRFGIMREQFAAYSTQSNFTPFDQNFPDGEWIVIDPPKGPQGKQSVGAEVMTYRTYVISTRAMQQGKGPAIARLLEWMSSEEGYFLLGWGVEGVNYVIGTNGAPTIEGLPDPSRGFNRPEMQPLTQLRNMVFYNSPMELKARFPVWHTIRGRTMDTIAILEDMQSRPWTPRIGSDALPGPNADVKRFLEQGVVEFLTGRRTLERGAWETWVSEFDRVGGKAWEEAALAAAESAGYIR